MLLFFCSFLSLFLMKRNTHTKLQERKNAHAYEYYTNPGLIREQQRDSERKWYVQNITFTTKNENKLILSRNLIVFYQIHVNV
jgi:hypothetical protein